MKKRFIIVVFILILISLGLIFLLSNKTDNYSTLILLADRGINLSLEPQSEDKNQFKLGSINNNTFIVILGFDIPPLLDDVKIKKAELCMNNFSAKYYTHYIAVEVCSYNNDWEEYNLSWDNVITKFDYNKCQNILDPFYSSSDNDVFAIDITQTLNNMISNCEYSLIIKMQDEVDFNFYTFDSTYTSNIPRLKIEFCSN